MQRVKYTLLILPPNLQRVNLLAMETRRLVKCNHSRKTAAFVRACVAYTFITIPSVSNVLSRLNLFILSGRVAVANGALSQGEQAREGERERGREGGGEDSYIDCLH